MLQLEKYRVLFFVFVAGLVFFAIADMTVPREEAETAPLYPYADIIEQWSSEHGVDPHLVAAVIKNESAFDPQRRSSEGAIGLMQVLPSTAMLVVDEMGLGDFSEGDLFTPSFNIQVGSHYLAGLLSDFAGDEVAALAAYNAGPGRVAEWQEGTQWLENTGIDRIPLMETQSYVLLVLQDRDRFAAAEPGS